MRGFDPATRSGTVFCDDGTVVAFGAAAFDASGLRLLRRARAGRAREAAVHGYRDPGPFVAEFYPGGAGADPGGG